MKNILLFDLDGTLTDPGEGITNSVKYALAKFCIEVKDKSELYSFIGPPLYDSFREKYGMSHDDANMAVTYYREYFAPRGMFENTVYDGVTEMLEELKRLGKTLIVATSKPERFAVQILEHFHLDGYFHKIVGATMDEKMNKKDEIIEYTLKSCAIDPDEAVMIGDRRFDIEGGHKSGLLTVGVLYGYGSHSEMIEAKADHIAKDVAELREILTKKI